MIDLLIFLGEVILGAFVGISIVALIEWLFG